MWAVHLSNEKPKWISTSWEKGEKEKGSSPRKVNNYVMLLYTYMRIQFIHGILGNHEKIVHWNFFFKMIEAVCYTFTCLDCTDVYFLCVSLETKHWKQNNVNDIVSNQYCWIWSLTPIMIWRHIASILLSGMD